jgi:NAD+ kinase
MLEVTVTREGRAVFHDFCLNEAAVSAAKVGKLITLEVRKGTLSLGAYRADALLAATPTGSTAYNAAAGGPILAPETETFVLTPVCPFSFCQRPLVTDGEPLVITVKAGQREAVALFLDGQEAVELREGDEARVDKAPFKARIAGSGESEFYAALKTKLHWLGENDA